VYAHTTQFDKAVEFTTAASSKASDCVRVSVGYRLSPFLHANNGWQRDLILYENYKLPFPVRFFDHINVSHSSAPLSRGGIAAGNDKLQLLDKIRTLYL
jgi:hypothetical protein